MDENILYIDADKNWNAQPNLIADFVGTGFKQQPQNPPISIPCNHISP